MAGNNLFNFKLLIDNLPELNQAIKDLNNSLSKDFNPLVKTLADSIKDLKKIDHNTVQAIQAQHNGLSVGRNKTVINEDTMNWAVQDSRRMKKLQGMIEKAQEEQLRIIEEENKYRLEVLKERKRENDHAKWSEDYRDRSLQFKKDVALGKYDENRAFNSTAKGYFAQRLYQSSKDMANGRGAINNIASSAFSQVFGQAAGSYIGNFVVSSIGKAMRRRASVMEVDDDGNEIGPKYSIGKISRFFTKGGTLSGIGVNAAGGGIALLAQVALAAGSAIKTFNDRLIESASGLERLTAQLGVVSGSQSSAFETFQMIKDYAFNSPYTTTETTQAAVLLKQSGVLVSNLDKTIRMLGDLGMGNQERLTHISNNYAQILAAGRANSKDLREFANAGIPIYNALLDYFKNDPDTDVGNTTEAVRKLAEEGKVTSNVISRVFEKLVQPGGMFYGASSTYANTYSGQMTNLQDRLEIAKGNAADLDKNFFANLNKKLLKLRIKFYESLFDDQEIIERQIEKTKDEQDKSYLRGIAVENDKNLKGKEVYDDEDFEALSEEERKTAISLSKYREILESYAIESFKRKTNEENQIYEDAFGLGLYDKNELAKYIDVYTKGFRELFAKRGSQRASDFFAGLYQDSNSFAYKASNLSSAGSVYKSNSDEYKAGNLREERLKHLATIQQYKEYDDIYRKEREEVKRNFQSTGGGLRVKNFNELYDFWSSGYLSGNGKIELSKDSKDFKESDVTDLKTNIVMMTNGIRKGLEENKQLPKYVGEAFENLLTSVDYLKFEDGSSVDNVNKALQNIYEVIGRAKKGKKRTEEERNFLDQLEQLINFSLIPGYQSNDKPLDYKESFKLKTLRGTSGLDAKNGNTIQANIDEILRRQNKTIGTSSFRSKLNNSTLADLVASGNLLYNGRKNSYGGMEVDYMAMGENQRKKFSDMADTLSRVNVNLHNYEEEMKVYASDIRKQIDSYTQLEETLQLGEEKLSEAFNIMEDSQRASITAYGKVITRTGREYSDLRFENGILQANISNDKNKEEWTDVLGNSDLTLVMDDLVKQIADSKTDLLLLESRIKENTIVLTKINNIREQGNNRRFGNILTNSNYFAQKGFVADKGSDFFKDFNSVFASLYSEYMGLNLPDLSDELHGKEVAKSYMGGKYSYGQLRNIQDLQTKAPYESDSWIMKQLEIILGDNFKLLIDEFKKSQKTYDDQVGWKNLLASSIGLSYDTVKNKGTVGSLEIFGKLQSRDILKSTMIGLAQSGATMGDMSNLGVKIADGTYNWNRTRANLFGKALNGEFNLETLNGFKTGLENSRNAIIDLQATLLTATETTSENNKAITDVLSTMFSGNKLKGILNGTEIELEQYLDEKTGTYGFKNKKTGEVVDTLNENFQFEQETTAKTLQELSNITNATLNSVKLLESMKSSLEAVENDTRELAIKNTFSSMSEYTPYFRGGNPYGQTSRASAWQEYYENAYNNTRGTFINSALEIAKMDINSETLKQNLKDFNKKNGTSFDEENVSTVIENAQKLKKAIDTGDKEEIIRLLELLGFDQYSTSSASSAYATQGVISDRISSYKNLVGRFSSLNGYEQGFKNRIMSRYLGVSDVEESVLDIAQGRNPTAKNLSDEELMSAREKLINGFLTEKLESVQDGLSKAFDTFLIDNLTNSFEEMGALVRASADDWSSLGKSFVNTVKSMTSNMGTLMTTAGLELLIGSGGTEWAPALALIAAGGASSFVSGLLDSSEKDKNDEKLKKLEVLKNDLKDLLAQAKADAIYYEKELSNKQAITTTNNMVKVNDAVITPSGKVISTHPDDYLIATKTPQTLGASAPVVNLNIVNNSGQKLDIKQTTSSRNGQLNIEAVIEGVVNKGLANGSFDSGMNARDQRLAGRRVYM